VEQDLAAIAAGLDGHQRAAAVRRLGDAHASLVAEVQRLSAADFTRTAPVVFGSATDAYPTAASAIVGWVDAHYVEHTEHINALLEGWSEANAGQTQAVIERFGDAFNGHDVDAVLALMTDDCVFEDTEPPPDGTRCLGKAEVGARFAALFEASRQARFSTEELVVCADRAVVRWRYDWGDGHVRGVDVLKVRDGLVAEKLAYVKG
jgi:ketosteroid isomerase-like protein